MLKHPVRSGLVAAALCLLALPVAAAPAMQTWVPTWYASPEPTGNAEAVLTERTLRQVVRVSAGGGRLRVRFSNAYGAEPLKIDEIHVAHRAGGSRIDPASDTAVTFGGRAGVTIAPGAYVLSDPIALKVAAGGDLAISFYVAGPVKLATIHDIQRGALYVAEGNAVALETLPEARADLGIGSALPWLSEVEVSDTPATAALMTFGDSITDGYGITPDQGATWPALLSRRLHDAGIPLSVVNAGISGNRLLHHGMWAPFGTGGLARFDRDVLAQPNVAAVIVLLGINDLGHAAGPGSEGYVSAEDMTDGLSQLAMRAHARGLKIYVATLTPFRDTVFDGYYSDEKEARRQTINAWIRGNTVFDGVIDFDKTLEDPAAPGHLQTAFDLGDHLHPADAGAAAMAGAVPLKLFGWARVRHRR